MIGRALATEILRLHQAERWPIGTIARQLRVHHSTVRRVLADAGAPAAQKMVRRCLVDPYRAFCIETLTKYPTLRASRLYQMVKARGYPGKPDHFRAVVALLRPRPAAEAFLRLRTLPAEQGQIDWAHFGKLTIGRAQRPLMAFVMVLSYSRAIFLRFYLGASMGYFMRGHVEAFAELGIARTLLYDNLRSCVLERVGDAIHFHPSLLELAAHYRVAPRPVAVARGNEKGRVERAIRFVRDAFFAARSFRDLDDLNAQARAWCQGQALDRPWPEDRQRTVRSAYQEERPLLLAAPEHAFPAEERIDVRAPKVPYVRFDWNDYSIPHDRVRRTLSVAATLTSVRIIDGLDVIAVHPRSFDRGAQIEDPAHIEALVEQKRAARTHRSIDRLQHAVPSVTALFKLAAERSVHLGSLTRGLTALLDRDGAAALEAAVAAALAKDAPHLATVRHLIDQQRHARGLRPAIAVPLPDDPRLRPVVRPHSLSDYEQLSRSADESPDA